MDAKNKSFVDKLHPKVRAELPVIIDEINARLTANSKVRIAQGLRTFAEQDALYTQGRTTKGVVVTQAKGGQSIHNYGLAVDFFLLIDGNKASWDVKADWDKDKKADWDEVVEVFKKYDWVWGGNWTSFKDMPHFEKTFGHTWKTLKALKDAKKVDKEGYVII